MKTLGMIGGVSWESTAVYYKQINEQVTARLGGLSSAPLVLFSMNYQELVDYKNQNDWHKISKRLCETAQRLEQAGAEAVLLCCNTLHKVALDIETAIHVPFIHIIDAAGVVLQQKKIRKIGLLGTRFTLEDGFYQARLQDKFQIDVLVPQADACRTLDHIIYQELCVGIFSEQSKQALVGIIQNLVKNGAESILLGCTELGLLMPTKTVDVPILDTTVLHADLAVSWMMQQD